MSTTGSALLPPDQLTVTSLTVKVASITVRFVCAFAPRPKHCAATVTVTPSGARTDSPWNVPCPPTRSSVVGPIKNVSGILSTPPSAERATVSAQRPPLMSGWLVPTPRRGSWVKSVAPSPSTACTLIFSAGDV